MKLAILVCALVAGGCDQKGTPIAPSPGTTVPQVTGVTTVSGPTGFVLTGAVSDSSGAKLDHDDGVTIEVLSGTGAGKTAGINYAGDFMIHGVAGPVQLRASAPGFAERIRDVVVTGDANELFVLAPLETPVNVSGVWTMTVTTAHACRTGSSLPDIASRRAYQLQLTQQGTRLKVTISSPTLLPLPNYVYARGTVVGSRVRLVFIGESIEPAYDWPNVFDQLTTTERFGFSGLVEGTLAGGEIRTTLEGDLVYVIPPRSVTYCGAKDHSVTLTR